MVAAFARASDAVLAALDAQLALAAEVWPTPGPLRVRMAVHAGEARVVDDGNYAGRPSSGRPGCGPSPMAARCWCRPRRGT